MNRLLLTWCIGLACMAASAQTPSCMHYTVSDGLPGNLVYCCIQDQRGLLWFGTDKGLACFDGSRFTTYGIEDNLPDPEVLSLKEDSQGRLWIFCFQKGPCYMLHGRIVTSREDPLLAKIRFDFGSSSICDDGKGGIWFAGLERTFYCLTNDSVYSFKQDNDIIVRIGLIQNEVVGFGSKYIIPIMPDAPLSDTSNSLNHYRKQTSPVMGYSGNHILYSYQSELKLVEYRNGITHVVDQMPYPKSDVFVDKSGRFWLCSATQGALCFDNPNRDLGNPVKYFPDKKITGMLQDAQGTLWFCTADDGVYGLPQSAPITYKGDKFSSLNIRAISRNEAGEILAGDNAGTVYVISRDSIRKIDFCTPKTYNLVRRILPTEKGSFWATMDRSLFYCSSGYQSIQDFKENTSPKDIALQGNKLWMASSRQLGYYARNSTEKHEVIIARRFTSVMVDQENIVWAGGISGLYSESDSFQINWGDRFPELNFKITALAAAGPNQIWVANAKSGLIRLTVHAGVVTEVEPVNKKLKTPIYNIQALFSNPGKNIWMATNKGVYCLNDQYELFHYDVHDGLAANDVNALVVYKDTLWAATVSGISRLFLKNSEEKGDFRTFIVNLSYLMENQVKKNLHLLDSLRGHPDIIVPQEATSLEIDLAGLDYQSRGNMRFEILQTTRLLPWNWWTFGNWLAWLSNQKNTTVSESDSYKMGTYIPSGSYLIQVTAVRLSGTRSQEPDVWTIVKLPLWYQTVWVQLLLLSMIGYGIFRIFQVRNALVKARATASVLQLQALQSQLNPHFIGNAINAIQQFLHQPDPIKASDYITTFIRLLRRTMKFSEMTFITLDEELAYDREYLKLTELRFEDQFFYDIKVNDDVPLHILIPSMLLQPIIENATIHGMLPAGVSMLNLHFFLDGDRLKITVTDNGLGFNETRRQKMQFGRERESKGISLLLKKIDSLNALYHLDMELNIMDLADQDPSRHGTQITISYNPKTHGK
jgi:ligand-binding sensor domain-containing protein